MQQAFNEFISRGSSKYIEYMLEILHLIGWIKRWKSTHQIKEGLMPYDFFNYKFNGKQSWALIEAYV